MRYWCRPIAVGLTIVLLALTLYQGADLVARMVAEDRLGDDFIFYRDAGQRWLETGSPYHADQLRGPYENIQLHSVLYPPNALVLFVPLALLPFPLAAVAFWGIPAAILVAVLRRFRPAAWSWPIMAALALWPRSVGDVVYGNTDLWVAAGVAGGLAWGWPALLVTIKPSILPLALVGIRDRRWWLGLVALVVVSLPFAGLWPSYFVAMRDVSGVPWTYSLVTLPLCAIGVVAWLARDRKTPPEPKPERGWLGSEKLDGEVRIDDAGVQRVL